MSAEWVQEAVRQGHGRWIGCDWDTQFGPFGLNLRGISARQARLVANATAGAESQAWREAECWLGRVESDAHDAEAAAAEAVFHAINGEWAEAEHDAARTHEIEMSYPRSFVWLNLLATIRRIRANFPDVATQE